MASIRAYRSSAYASDADEFIKIKRIAVEGRGRSVPERVGVGDGDTIGNAGARLAGCVGKRGVLRDDCAGHCADTIIRAVAGNDTQRTADGIEIHARATANRNRNGKGHAANEAGGAGGGIYRVKIRGPGESVDCESVEQTVGGIKIDPKK